MPTPGDPVSPTTWACPAYGASAAATSRRQRAGVLDQPDQPGHRTRVAVPGPGRPDPGRPGAASLRSPGSAGRGRSARRPGRRRRRARPRRCRRRAACSSSARCSTIRAPDMPIGWPSAIAPPLTLTLVRVEPELPARLDADRRERLVDLDQVEVASTSRPSLRRAWLMALAGCDCSELSGPATLPWAPISASHVEPELLGLRLAHHHDGARAVGDLRRRAGGDRAVLAERRTQPGQRLGRGVGPDALVVARTRPGRPCAAGSATGTISSSNTPFFRAAAARWCERAANSSCSSRVDAEAAVVVARSTHPSRCGRRRRSSPS